MSEKMYVTQEGLNDLKSQLENLKTNRRAEIAAKIRIARDFGDLSENSEYDEAKNEQAMVESRISKLEDQLRNVDLINSKDITSDKVSLGTTVTIHDIDFDEKMTYRIVASIEANNSEDETISNESPVGKALLGHKIGDKVVADLPNGSHATFEIMDIKL